MSPTERMLSEFIVGEILNESVGNSIDADQALIESGILNSLALQQLVGFIEKKFDVELDDEHLVIENFSSISAIAKLVETIRP